MNQRLIRPAALLSVLALAGSVGWAVGARFRQRAEPSERTPGARLVTPPEMGSPGRHSLASLLEKHRALVAGGLPAWRHRIATAETSEGAVGSAEMAAIFDAWASADARDLARWLSENSGKSSTGTSLALRALLAHDVPAALTVVRKMSSDLSVTLPLGRALLAANPADRAAAFEMLAMPNVSFDMDGADPARVLEAIRQQAPESVPTVLSACLREWVMDDPRGALDWVRRFAPDPKAGARDLVGAMEQTMYQSFERKADKEALGQMRTWLETNRLMMPELARGLSRLCAGAGDFECARQAAMALTGSERLVTLGQASADEVVDTFRRDPAAARELALGKEPGGERDMAVQALFFQFAGKSAEGSLRFYHSLEPTDSAARLIEGSVDLRMGDGFLHLVEHPQSDVPVPDFVVRSVVSGQRALLGRAGAEEWVETLPPAVREAARAELAPKPRQ